jgi:hypothetical protein
MSSKEKVYITKRPCCESSQAFGLLLNHSEIFRGLPLPSPDFMKSLCWCLRRSDRLKSAAFVRERFKSAARVSSMSRSVLTQLAQMCSHVRILPCSLSNAS